MTSGMIKTSCSCGHQFSQGYPKPPPAHSVCSVPGCKCFNARHYKGKSPGESNYIGLLWVLGAIVLAVAAMSLFVGCGPVLWGPLMTNAQRACELKCWNHGYDICEMGPVDKQAENECKSVEQLTQDFTCRNN